jgi:hypothetical protein
MTTSVTDEMVNHARHAAMTYRPTPEPLEGPQVSISFGQMRAALEAALRSQGKVVSVEKLKALQPYWCDWNDQALDEETDPEGSLKSFPKMSIVYKYEDLTAIIGEGD